MEEKKNTIQNDISENMTNEGLGGIDNDDQNKNGQEGDQACGEKPEEEIRAHEGQEESNEEKGTDPAKEEADPFEKENGSGTEAKADDRESVREEPQERFSCSYKPPYYVPNFTVQDSKEQKKKKKSVAWGRTWVAILLVLCLGVSFVAGGVSVLVLRKNLPAIGSGAENEMTIIKNDGSIKVNEKVGSTGYNNLSVSGVVALVADSVVEITTTQVQTDSFFGNYVTGGAGSGVMVDVNGNGYIITNNHVIEGASQIVVRLTNGAEYVATSLGGDDDYDIAVLKIEATGLAYATMGSSASLTVGDEVVAIGNPLGELGGTVTNGIVSALDRSITVDGHRMTLLQTNAAINPGNSGGGLFNMAGELIGIVNAKQSDTGIEGLGFAIPIDIAWQVAQDIIEHGYVTGKPDYGFEVAEAASAFTVTEGWNRYSYPAGIYVNKSNHESLQYLDRIVSVNGITINSSSDFLNAIDPLAVGDVMRITVSRRDGSKFREVTVEITIAEYVPKQ